MEEKFLMILDSGCVGQHLWKTKNYNKIYLKFHLISTSLPFQISPLQAPPACAQTAVNQHSQLQCLVQQLKNLEDLNVH